MKLLKVSPLTQVIVYGFAIALAVAGFVHKAQQMTEQNALNPKNFPRFVSTRSTGADIEAKAHPERKILRGFAKYSAPPALS